MKTWFLAASLAALAALSGCVGYYSDGYGYGRGYGYAGPGDGGAGRYSRGYREGDRRNDAWRHDSQGERDRGDRPGRRESPDDWRN